MSRETDALWDRLREALVTLSEATRIYLEPAPFYVAPPDVPALRDRQRVRMAEALEAVDEAREAWRRAAL